MARASSGVISQCLNMQPESPSMIPFNGLFSDSNCLNRAEFLKILESCTDPDQLATQLKFVVGITYYLYINAVNSFAVHIFMFIDTGSLTTYCENHYNCYDMEKVSDSGNPAAVISAFHCKSGHGRKMKPCLGMF